jgi:hypothetical protein
MHASLSIDPVFEGPRNKSGFPVPQDTNLGIMFMNVGSSSGKMIEAAIESAGYTSA